MTLLPMTSVANVIIKTRLHSKRTKMKSSMKMRTQDNTNDSRMQKTVGDFFTAVRSLPEVALNVRIEPELILQDIELSEEEFKPAVDAVIVKQYLHGDVQSVVENIVEKFYSNHYRECPLTIPPNMNGLVGSSTFWENTSSCRNGLYDFCIKGNKDQTLTPVFFPAKQLNVNRFYQIPNNDPAPISLMAQYLYNQMEELSEMKARVECAGTDTDTGHCKREMESQDVHKGEITACKRQEDVQRKKKSVGSRVMRCLRRLCCCVGKNGDE